MLPDLRLTALLAPLTVHFTSFYRNATLLVFPMSLGSIKHTLFVCVKVHDYMVFVFLTGWCLWVHDPWLQLVFRPLLWQTEKTSAFLCQPWHAHGNGVVARAASGWTDESFHAPVSSNGWTPNFAWDVLLSELKKPVGSMCSTNLLFSLFYEVFLLWKIKIIYCCSTRNYVQKLCSERSGLLIF